MIDDDDGFGQHDGRAVVISGVVVDVTESASRLLKLVQLQPDLGLLLRQFY